MSLQNNKLESITAEYDPHRLAEETNSMPWTPGSTNKGGASARFSSRLVNTGQNKLDILVVDK